MENIKEELAKFINPDGKVIDYPGKKKRSLRPYIYLYLASKFADDKDYTEPEVNQVIKSWIEMEDYIIWRREMVEYGLLSRTNDCKHYHLTMSQEQRDSVLFIEK